MFKKSILAAVLLLSGAGAASAAEIGVQSTWGHSTTNIYNGRYMSETTSASAYAERSRVDVLGWNSFEESEVTSGVAPGEEYVLLEDINVSTETVDRNAAPDRFGSFYNPLKRDAQEVDILEGGLEGLTVREGETTTTTNETARGGQVSWARAGRLELGGSFTRTTDSYDYDGIRTSGFSGTTAFTR